MTKLVLIRHGRSTANAAGILAGRADGVELDEVGREQAGRLGGLFAEVKLAATYRSPILRCEQTASAMGRPDAVVVEGLTECDYGDWTNRPLKELADEPLWSQIQRSPSAVAFPLGESMLAMRDRAVAAAEEIVARHGPDETVAVVSHGDPIKAILSAALGQDFDDFQRLNVGPASISVVEYGPDRPPFVVCINANTDVAALLHTNASPVVGGGDAPAK